MNSYFRIILYYIFLILGFIICNNSALADVDFTEIVEKASPAIVNISTTQDVDFSKKILEDNDSLPFDLFEFFEKDFGLQFEKKRKMHALGSGFIISSEGYIVTNWHVIDGAHEIKVTLSNEPVKSYSAKVIGKDKKTDIALLKIDVKKSLPYLTFGNSDEAKVGNWILAIGNPFGFGGTVTKGIISAKARYLNVEQYDDYIQTDAAINRGSSGSPMLNMKGEVIGVNTIIVSPSGGSVGIGFAIPSGVVEYVVGQIKEKGFVQRGWLGVKIQYIDQDLASAIGLSEPKGALVSEVMKDSPAEKAGIKVGDVIIKYDGKDVIEIHSLPRFVGKTEIDKTVQIELFSDSKITHVTAKILKLPNESNDEDGKKVIESNKETEKNKILGMKLHNLDSKLKTKYKIPDHINGVLITSLDVENSKALGKVRPGEVILSIGKIPVKNVDDVIKVIESVKKQKASHVALLVYFNNNSRFVTLELK